MKVVIIVVALALGAAAGAGGAWVWMMQAMSGGESAQQGEGEVLYYRHPMDPSITSDTPDKDSMGMDYIPVYDEDNGDDDDRPGIVSIDPAVSQNLGVRTGEVELGELQPAIAALGFVAYDESGLVHTHVRTQGWVEDLQVRTTGETVTAGQILFRFDSPQLRNAQEELLQALRRNSGVSSSRERLRTLGMAPEDIDRVVARGESMALVPVRARSNGVVQSLAIAEGMTVGPDMTLFTIADLSRVWVMLEVFESEMDFLYTGQSARVTLPFRPEAEQEAAVDYVYPSLIPGERVQRARLVLDNPDGQLRPGMQVRVALNGEAQTDVLHVPASAVIRTGHMDRLVVALEEGRFQVREVALGRRIGDRYVIREGVEQDERVVVSGQFLLDSESASIAELGRMDGDGDKAGADADDDAVWTRGRVVRINQDDNTAMLQHEPVPEWGWPEMTMEFQLGEELEQKLLQPGTPVRFRMREHPEGGYEVIEMEADDESGDDQSRAPVTPAAGQPS